MESHPAALDEDQLAAQCDLKFVRRSGPGGQHRNKVSTGVLVKHRPTGLVAEATERRSQAENRRTALRRLRCKLAVALRRELVDPQAPPSPLWKQHLREGRIAISQKHAAYPALVAEALDRLASNHWDLASTAQQLGTTPSQLVRLLRRLPPALDVVNTHRSHSGLPPLR